MSDGEFVLRCIAAVVIGVLFLGYKRNKNSKEKEMETYMIEQD